ASTVVAHRSRRKTGGRRTGRRGRAAPPREESPRAGPRRPGRGWRWFVSSVQFLPGSGLRPRPPAIDPVVGPEEAHLHGRRLREDLPELAFCGLADGGGEVPVVDGPAGVGGHGDDA